MTSWQKCDKCRKYIEGQGSPEQFCQCPSEQDQFKKMQKVYDEIKEMMADLDEDYSSKEAWYIVQHIKHLF